MNEDIANTETRESRRLKESDKTDNSGATDASKEGEKEPPQAEEGKKGKKHTAPVMGAGIKLVEGAFRGSTRQRDPDTDIFDASNFRQVGTSWWLDRLLPGGVAKYFVTAFVICTVVWLIALTLRLSWVRIEDFWGDVWLFVKDRQWQLQPLLLLVHFVCLRLFKGIYSRNFDRAFQHLDVRKGELNDYKKWFLGNRVNFLALAVAAPFIIWEWVQFATIEKFYETVYGTSDYVQAIDTTVRNPEAFFLLLLWSLEWVMFGYYCYVMVSGAIVVRSILKKHDFKDSVDLVLTERQYRPLFNVTAQAGSLVFLFGLFHAGYMVYTKNTGSDIAGLIVLVVLLGVAFSMTWSAVRGELKGKVLAALENLEDSYRTAREKLGTMHDVPGIEDDIQRIQVQLKMQLALQQLDYLQTKYESLGRKEFLGLVFKMLAPVGSVMARVIRWGSLLAAIGLGGAAAISGGDKGNTQPPAVNQAPADPGDAAAP
ncbi:MAG: hypothetical protein K8I27_05220 [Planctomycetes bacterium]|nr:hypothetical protein [Planctomycetota bacterium]